MKRSDWRGKDNGKDKNLSKLSRIFDIAVTIWDSTDIKTDWKRGLISLNDSEMKKILSSIKPINHSSRQNRRFAFLSTCSL
jgi:hypothetical protein